MEEIRHSSASCSVSDIDMPTCDVFLQTGPSGGIQASRSQQEKERNPDRICLDRRGLTKLPLLVGETKVRLLSLQHNLITRLEGVSAQGLERLVFLDIYDNQLERIAGLDTLENLRVLLVGKNRIRRIEGLNCLTKLEVLDLHGNQISQVGGLSTLSELKVLNLAGNQIRVVGVSDLQGLKSLQELNLRRNRIKRLLGFGETPQLQKLFLSNNELHTVDNMNSIVKATQLGEITMDGNPVSLGGDCVSFLVSYLPHLKLLSCMEVTEPVRRAAMIWRHSKESTTNTNHQGIIESSSDVRREEVISNARTNWELLRSQTSCLSSSSTLSGSLKDLRSNIDFELTNERCVQSDSGVSSIASSLCTNPYKSSVELVEGCKSARPTPQNATEKKRQGFARRTVSQESSGSQNTVMSTAVSIDFFKLPPILAPLVDEGIPQEDSTAQEGDSVAKCNELKRYDSLSSVEPNVDSSLSSLPSDSSSSSDNNSSSSAEHSETESDDEFKSPQEVAKGIIKPPRNVKSAAHYRKHLPRRVQTRAATGRVQQKSSVHQGRVREQGGDFLVEICARCLNIYGQGALRFIDRPWNSGKAADVNTVKFNYVNFNSIIPVLGRIKQRFSNAEHFVFRETNIHCLGQLNALADIQGLTSLRIEPEGNSITHKEWQKYAIYRLSHWGLRIINGMEISDEEVVAAGAEFQGLSDIVLCSLPDTLLQPLLGRLHLEACRSTSQHQQQPVSAKQWLWNADPALRSVVAKEALQWRRSILSQEDMMWRHKGRSHLSSLLEVACAAVEKLRLLEEEWPAILSELVQETLVDYSHLDSYMKKCMHTLRV